MSPLPHSSFNNLVAPATGPTWSRGTFPSLAFTALAPSLVLAGQAADLPKLDSEEIGATPPTQLDTVTVDDTRGKLLTSPKFTEPLRDIAAAVRRVSDGDLSQPIPVSGPDVPAHLAESPNRLVADLERRDRQLGSILAAVERATPEDGPEAMANRATRDAESIFELIAGAMKDQGRHTDGG